MLVEFLDSHCMQVNLREKEAGKEKGEESSALAFDFVYLPIDFMYAMNSLFFARHFCCVCGHWTVFNDGCDIVFSEVE